MFAPHCRCDQIQVICDVKMTSRNPPSNKHNNKYDTEDIVNTNNTELEQTE